jgi:diguanylate cyclase (GGDEF)-like protein
MEIAEKIRRDISSCDFRNEKMKMTAGVTVSIGGATAGMETQNERDLIEQADTALYKAKEKRDSSVWLSPAASDQR